MKDRLVHSKTELQWWKKNTFYERGSLPKEEKTKYYWTETFIQVFTLRFKLKSQNYARKSESWKKCEYLDQTSYSQLRVNHRKQVYSTEFTHSNQNTGKNWSTSLDLRAATSRKLLHNSDFNHDFSIFFSQSGNIEKNYIIFFSSDGPTENKSVHIRGVS